MNGDDRVYPAELELRRQVLADAEEILAAESAKWIDEVLPEPPFWQIIVTYLMATVFFMMLGAGIALWVFR